MQLLRDNLTLWTSDMQGDGKWRDFVCGWNDFTLINVHCAHFIQSTPNDLSNLILGEGGEEKQPIQDVEDQDVS